MVFNLPGSMSVIFIDTSQLVKGAERLQNISKALADTMDDVLTASALDIELNAKQNVPVDRGFLKQNISAQTTQYLRKEITVNSPYAAYMEFGTGAYAAIYSYYLPPTWQEFARKFMGKTGGTFTELLKHIEEWVRRKGLGTGFRGTIGIAGTYSIKTRRRTGGASTQERQNKEVAYLIARKILKDGVKPHPFLFPAYMQQIPQLTRDIEAALKKIV